MERDWDWAGVGGVGGTFTRIQVSRAWPAQLLLTVILLHPESLREEERDSEGGSDSTTNLSEEAIERERGAPTEWLPSPNPSQSPSPSASHLRLPASSECPGNN